MATMMRKGGRRPRKTIAKRQAEVAKLQAQAMTQEEIDRAFVGHVRKLVRETSIGPATVLLHLLFDALDRLKVT